MSILEDGMHRVLISNYQVFGVGKSVKNIRYIICAESIKSEDLLMQSTGRGMRISDSKDHFTWIDIVDDMRIEITAVDGMLDQYKNYMWKWYLERKKYYKSEGFEIHQTDMNLNGL